MKPLQNCPCPSQANCIFADLDSTRYEWLNQVWERIVYPSSAIVITEADEAHGVYCICSGRVKGLTRSLDGRTLSVVIGKPGDILGARAVLLGKPYALTGETLEPTELRFIRKKEFLDFLSQSADVTLRLARKLSVELNEAYRRERDLALKGTFYRVVEMLVRFCRTEGEATPRGLKLKISMNREELAEVLGTSSRNLTRALRQLRELGVIEYQRHSIIVLDQDLLQSKLGGETLW